MLSGSSDTCFEDNKTIIDPTCGTGNFLVEIVKRKIEHGVSPWQTLLTTFGVDIMADNVKECRVRILEAADVEGQKYRDLLKTTIVRGDILEESFDELFHYLLHTILLGKFS